MKILVNKRVLHVGFWAQHFDALWILESDTPRNCTKREIKDMQCIKIAIYRTSLKMNDPQCTSMIPHIAIVQHNV